MDIIKRLFRKCHFCRSKQGHLNKYKDDLGQTINVCQKCVPYAERRAYSKY